MRRGGGGGRSDDLVSSMAVAPYCKDDGIEKVVGFFTYSLLTSQLTAVVDGHP